MGNSRSRDKQTDLLNQDHTRTSPHGQTTRTARAKSMTSLPVLCFNTSHTAPRRWSDPPTHQSRDNSLSSINVNITHVNIVENEPEHKHDSEQGMQQSKNRFTAKLNNGIVPLSKREMRRAKIKETPEPTTQRQILTGSFLEVTCIDVVSHLSYDNEEMTPEVQEHHILRQEEPVIIARPLSDVQLFDKHIPYLHTSLPTLKSRSDRFINKPQRRFTFPFDFKENENESCHKLPRWYSDPQTLHLIDNTTLSMLLDVKTTSTNVEEKTDLNLKKKSVKIKGKQRKINRIGAKLIKSIAPLCKRGKRRSKRKTNPGPVPQRLSSTGPFLESCDSLASFEIVDHSSCNEESYPDVQQHVVLKQEEPVSVARLHRVLQPRDKNRTYLKTTSLPSLNTFSDYSINKQQLRLTHSADIKEKENKDSVYFSSRVVKGRSQENYFHDDEAHMTSLPLLAEPKCSSYQPLTLAELAELRPFLDVSDSIEDFDCLEDSLNACSQELSAKPPSRIRTRLSRFKQSCKKLIPKLTHKTQTDQGSKINGLQRENSCLVKTYIPPENRTRNIRIARPGQADPLIISGADTLGGLPEGEGSQSRFLTSWSLCDDASGCYGDGDTESKSGAGPSRRLSLNPAVVEESLSRSRSNNNISPRRKFNKKRKIRREDGLGDDISDDSEESSSKRRSVWNSTSRLYSSCRDLQPRAMHFPSPEGQGRAAHVAPRASSRLLGYLSSSSLDSLNSQLTSHRSVRSTSSADESCA